MSLLDTLGEKLADKATTELAKGSWVEKAVEAGRKQTDSLGELKPAAEAALDLMLANKDKLGQVSATGFTAIVSRLALGQDDKARLIYLASGEASFDELMAASDAASAASRKEKADREQAWKDFKAVSLAVLQTAGKVAVPLLMAAI